MRYIFVPILTLLLVVVNGCIAGPTDINTTIKKAWRELLPQDAPEIFPAGVTPQPPREGVKGIILKGVPYKSKETRFFSWYGVPETKNGEKVPAVVLLHGGNDTANAQWVEIWIKKGYAAIAMDLYGFFPSLNKGKIVKQHNDYSGPPTEAGSDFHNADEPFRDQWIFHAVADAILAHNFIRAQPGVDAEKIGIVGVSWGGFIALNAAAADPRFKLCISIYGCGFIGDESLWAKKIAKLEDKGKKWLRMWDPSNYLKDISVPTLWIGGVDDPYYPPSSRQKTYNHLSIKPFICLKPRMTHGLMQGFFAKETYTFVDAIFKNKKNLPEITSQGRDGQRVWITFKTDFPVKKILLVSTKDTHAWRKRKWETQPAQLNPNENKASAELPEGTSVYYFNIFYGRNRISSSPFVELK